MQMERWLVSSVPKHEPVTTLVLGGREEENSEFALIEIHHSINSQLAANIYFLLWQYSTG